MDSVGFAASVTFGVAIARRMAVRLAARMARVGERGLLERVGDGCREAGGGALGGGGWRGADSLVRGVGLVVGGRIARPRRVPLSQGGDVGGGELVGRELVVLESVELLGGERGVGGPQAGVAGERQLEELPSSVAVEGGGNVAVVARERTAEQRRGLRSDRVVKIHDRADIEPDAVVATPVAAHVESGRLAVAGDVQLGEVAVGGGAQDMYGVAVGGQCGADGVEHLAGCAGHRGEQAGLAPARQRRRTGR